MKNNKNLATLTALCGLAALSHSQMMAVPAFSGFRQVYNTNRSSFVSTVQSCFAPTPMPRAAADDCWFSDNFVVNHVRWWGTVSDIAQLTKTFYVAIYNDAACKPGGLIWEACLVPSTQPIVADCTGRMVYTFYATLPSPLAIAPGHYWFRVAESDADSVNQNAVDFRWSGRRPVRGCPAGTNDAAGTWFSPLNDACDGLPDDLAFCLLG